MPARIPTQNKSPFVIDPRPLDEMASPHAGLLATSRAFRSLRIPGLVAANLHLKQRRRGCDEAQYIESLVLLQTVAAIASRTSSCWRTTDASNAGWATSCPRPAPCEPFSTASTMRNWN